MSDTYWENEPDIEEFRRLHALLPTDPGQAVTGLEALADRRSMMSMWYLAEAYMGAYLPRDIGKAKHWYSLADQMGSPEASFMLGRICAQEGEQSAALAAFARGANRGYPPSMYRLARMYHDGLGTEKDIERCRGLLEEAASRGHVFAKRDLAFLYMRGSFGVWPVFRGLGLLAGLAVDIVGVVFRSLRRGPAIDERLLG